MKTFNSIQYGIAVCATLLMGLVAQVNALETTVTVMVRQIQMDENGEPNGNSVDKYFGEIDLLNETEHEMNKSFTALIEIGDYGSVFYLYVDSLETGEPEELATKFISAYSSPIATAAIEITSVDTHVPVRTRADEEFAVQVTVQNEAWKADVASGSAPEVSWDPYKVKITPSYSVKDESNSVTGTVEQTITYLNAETAATNTFEVESRLTIIPSPGRGEETFKVEGMSLINSSGEDVYKPVDSASIDIWPVAEGRFVGVNEGDTFTKSMPNITAEVWNLYPESYTYLDVYKLDGDVYKFYVRPQSATPLPYPASDELPHGSSQTPDKLHLTGWDKEIQHNGTYALKVFTVTPFHNREPELVTEVTGLIIDRQIVLKGSINTSESE